MHATPILATFSNTSGRPKDIIERFMFLQVKISSLNLR